MITVDEVLQLYLKNKKFYKNGGITISGGEPLLHLKFCHKLSKKCLKKNISLAFDTSGATFTKKNINKYKKITKHKPL
jgi:pyruvate formate lyase activating enzyme